VLNTSGSTGKPKAVVHTQYSILSAVIALEGCDMRSNKVICFKLNFFVNRIIGIKDTMMEFMGNYGVIANCILMYDLCHGVTTYHFTYFDKFDKEMLLENLIKYKVEAPQCP
jgi:long-subunit acyl-CoA synthetase (AMP-forming)